MATLYKFLMRPEGRIPVDWFAKQVAFADRTDGDIDTLVHPHRAYPHLDVRVQPRGLAGRSRSTGRGARAQSRTAYPTPCTSSLTQRFIDRRTSALMRGLKEKDELFAEIAEDGAVHVENHYVGRLQGFRFFPDAQAEGIHGKATRNAAAHVLANELAMRARRVAAAKNDAFKLTRRGQILWRDERDRAAGGGRGPAEARCHGHCDEHLSAGDKEKVQERLEAWLAEIVQERLKPLGEIGASKDISGLARGIAFRLSENFGSLRRDAIAEEIRSLDQTARAQLRRLWRPLRGVQYLFPALLKPASAELALVLWALKHGAAHGLDIDALPEPPRPGLTSVVADKAVPEAFYRVAGFHVCGPRAVRIDMLERLADLIRPLLAWRADRADVDPAQGRQRRRRVQGHARDDVDPGLLRGRARRCAAGARVPGWSACARPRLPPKPAEERPAQHLPAPADTAGALAARLPAGRAGGARRPGRNVADAMPSGGSRGAPEQPSAADASRPKGRRSGGQPAKQIQRSSGSDRAASRSARSRAADSAKERQGRRDGGPNGARAAPARRPRPAPRGTAAPVMQSAPPPRSGGVDPDSPFAALRALKPDLGKALPRNRSDGQRRPRRTQARERRRSGSTSGFGSPGW